jgi:hypothetical protein
MSLERWFAPTWLAWAAPRVGSKGVILKDPCNFDPSRYGGKLLSGRRRLTVRPAAFGAMPVLVGCGARARAAASSRQQQYIRTCWSNAHTPISHDSMAVRPFGERTVAPAGECGGTALRTQTPARREINHPGGVRKKTHADSRRAINNQPTMNLMHSASRCGELTNAETSQPFRATQMCVIFM